MANFSFGSNDYSVNIRAQHNVNFIPGWDTHRLALTFEVTARGNYTVDAPFLVSGTLWAHETPGPASWIGVLHTPRPVGLKSFAANLTLETSVTDQQLRGLERTRAGNDLALRAELSLTALTETKHWPVADDQEIIRVPHATWSNALTQLDAGAFVDVLIPVTTVEARATAARRIREAKTAIRDQRYEHAVALARAALDPVREACNTKKLHDQAVQKKAGERDQEERWAILIQSAYALFSGAPHDDAGTTENFTWTRTDAIAAVATAAGLLARLEDRP
ncbi:hypothetical protein AQI88_38755 [Streptomyces cellostaticus]|uniref:Uncharacterized protein n=1 Tax=Streptomyces cellostaticus TaxID=67285 RepID=A0A101NBT1_9ACTN|nr:hypothetical protein [Streptomyces cellostaticus]KUM90249.1 hypothetical protein AQI88_38755 [Streptomyces cellostaticus]GHI10424.1 hypothetical protein Scel_87450 [Streptomyces cellostaticus]